MYKIYLDGKLFCTPQAEELAINNPVVTSGRNKAGTFKFTMPPTHPRYHDIVQRRSIFEVYRDGEEEPIFAGPCMKINEDFYCQRTVECEGELTYFNDSIQRPARYQGVTVRQLLEIYVAIHNSQVDEYKQFTVGMVTVHDSNDYISCFTNDNSTMTEIKEDLIDDLGGYFRIRHADGVRYLDYLAEPIARCPQPIRLGENLLDYNSNIDVTQLHTIVIPRGAKLEESAVEGLETRLTIEGVNNGKDYLESDVADTYGKSGIVVVWDDVTTPEKLLSKGKKYLADTQFANVVIQAKAIDLSIIEDKEPFRLNYEVEAISKPHGMDRWFPVTKITNYLWNPEKDIFELGINENQRLSARTSHVYQEIIKAIEKITPSSTILEMAKKNATEIIKLCTAGNVVFHLNEKMKPYEILIMDTDDIKTAKNVWRYNLNGWGYSTNGYDGPYKTAATLDGGFVADFITAGTMSADRIKGGTFTAGGPDNGNGVIKVLDENGNTIATLDLNGLKVQKGAISGNLVKGGTIIGANFQNAEQYPTFSVDNTGNIKGASISASKISTTNGSFSIMDGETWETKVGGLYCTNQSFGVSTSYGQMNVQKLSVGSGSIGGITIASTKILAMEDVVWKLMVSNKYIALSPYVFAGNASLGNYDNRWPEMYANYVWAGGIGLQVIGNCVIDGSFSVGGTKARIVNTKNYGKRELYAYETPTPMFGDIGEGILDDEGCCYIYNDEIFSESIDKDTEYQVFLQPYGEGECYVCDRQAEYFVVKGTPKMKFAWEIKAIQRDYNMTRTEEHEDIKPEIDDITIQFDYMNTLNDSIEVDSELLMNEDNFDDVDELLKDLEEIS